MLTLKWYQLKIQTDFRRYGDRKYDGGRTVCISADLPSNNEIMAVRAMIVKWITMRLLE